MQFYDPNLIQTDVGFNTSTDALGYLQTYCLQSDDWDETTLYVNSTDPLAGIYSPKYNNYQASTTAIQTANFNGKSSWTDLLLCSKERNSTDFSIKKVDWKNSTESLNEQTTRFHDNINAFSVMHDDGREIIIWNNRETPIFWEDWELSPGIHQFQYDELDELTSITIIDGTFLKYN